MDGWKALVMIVAILVVAGVAIYIFNAIKNVKVDQAKAEAVTGFLKTGPDMISGFIPRGK